MGVMMPEMNDFGIGLNLSKKLVHQIDGEIIVSSIKGKGSTFSIRLPLA
jgi:signal transduction histidine kinase